MSCRSPNNCCASFSAVGGLGPAQQAAQRQLNDKQLIWARSEAEQGRIDTRVAELLGKPLTADAAVQDVIITSMLKRVDVAVFSYITAVAANNLGSLPKAFDLKVDGVGYATSGGKMGDITAKLDGYKAEIISGKIMVKSTR